MPFPAAGTKYLKSLGSNMNHFGRSRYFDLPHSLDAEGLVCVGGELSAEWLLDAYAHGIFPWPITEDLDSGNVELLAWWTPDPRAIIDLDALHISARLARRCRKREFTVTCNRDFSQVIHACASVQDRTGNTWLTPSMVDAYVALHELGYAHSVEAWHQGELAGGIYGVALGGMFAAESKFYHRRDASKVALVYLVHHLSARGFCLLDIQQISAHTDSLGAREIPRSEFVSRVEASVNLPVTFGEKLEGCRW